MSTLIVTKTVVNWSDNFYAIYAQCVGYKHLRGTSCLSVCLSDYLHVKLKF